jgi:hypothetical protein
MHPTETSARWQGRLLAVAIAAAVASAPGCGRPATKAASAALPAPTAPAAPSSDPRPVKCDGDFDACMTIVASTDDASVGAEAMTSACEAALRGNRKPDDVYTSCTHALRRLTERGAVERASRLADLVCDLAATNGACTDVVFDAKLAHFDLARAGRVAERLAALPAADDADRAALLDPSKPFYDVGRARRVLAWAERRCDGRASACERLLPHLADRALPHYDAKVAERVLSNYENACFKEHLSSSCETLATLTRKGGLAEKPAVALRAAAAAKTRARTLEEPPCTQFNRRADGKTASSAPPVCAARRAPARDDAKEPCITGCFGPGPAVRRPRPECL